MKKPTTFLNNILSLRWAASSASLALLMTTAPLMAQPIQSGTRDGINLYANPPGLADDSPYIVEIKSTAETAAARRAYVFKTTAPTSPLNLSGTGNHSKNERYYDNLWGCSHSYVNFERTKSVTVTVSIRGGASITKAKIYPENKVTNLSVSSNKITFTLANPCNVAVDVNSQMSERQNGSGQLHSISPKFNTLSIHANPVLASKPNMTDSNVVAINPAGTESSPLKPASLPSGKDIMYFKPGIHHIGANFKVQQGKKYYIPGDAIVYGGFNNVNDTSTSDIPANLWDASNVVIYGHGTISGSTLKHWEMDKVNTSRSYGNNGDEYPGGGEGSTEVLNSKKQDPNDPTKLIDTDEYKEQQRISYRKNAVNLEGCWSSRVEGIVIADPANHSLKLFSAGLDAARASTVAWVKVFAWRVNSDGGGINDSSHVNNCFYRVQDDGFYPKGITLKDCALWSDANGASMRLSAMPDLKGLSFKVENIDVIFRRNKNWSDSAAIELPPNDSGGIREKPYTFSNINISDPFPTKAPINIVVAKSGGTFKNHTFENVTIAKMPINPSNTSQILKNKIQNTTGTGGAVNNIKFVNLKINNITITSFAQAQTYFDFGTGVTSSNITFSTGGVTQPSGVLIANGKYTIQRENGGAFLTAISAWNPISFGSASGANIQWTIVNQPTLNQVAIVSANTANGGAMLEVPDTSVAAGTPVRLSGDAVVRPHSTWKVEKSGSSYRFTPVLNSGFAMDAWVNGTLNVVHLWNNEPTNANQKFTVTPVF